MSQTWKARLAGWWSGLKLWTYKYVGGLVMEEKKDGHLAMSLGRASFVAVLCWMLFHWSNWEPTTQPVLATLPPGMMEVFYVLASYNFGTKVTGAIKACLRVVPQTNEPSAGQAGDVWIGADLKKLAIHNGTKFRFHPVQSFEILATSAFITNTSAETIFSNGTHTIPADTMRIGSVIRMVAWGSISALNTTQDMKIRCRLGGLLGSQVFIFDMINLVFEGQEWRIDATIIIRTATTFAGSFVGAAGVQGNTQNNHSGIDTSQANTDIALSQDLVVTAQWSVADAANFMSMEGWVVDIT